MQELIPSVIFHDYRIRFVHNKAYNRHPTETFHDFLEFFTKEKLQLKWFQFQAGMPTEKQHILFRCAYEYNMRKQNGSLIDVRKERDGSSSCLPSGLNLFWLSFCFDLFYLAHNNLLTEALIKRLKNQQYFQGARYEMATAVILLKAGFAVSWLKEGQQKTCDLEAIHKITKEKIVVEAKSKIRKNIQNSTNLDINDNKGLEELFNDSLAKNVPLDSKLVVFIDANLPYVEASAMDKPLLQEAKELISSHGTSNDRFSLLVITNFPMHYGNSRVPASPPENCIVLPNNNIALPSQIIHDIDRSLKNYWLIPEEL